MQSPEIAPKLPERYTPRRFLARDGSGTAHVAHDNMTGEDVVVKLFDFVHARDLAFVQRAASEVARARMLTHPSLLRHFSFEHDGDICFMTLEWIQGPTLQQKLDERGSEPLDVGDVIQVGVEIAGALAEAHSAGLLHGDVQPRKIVMRPDGTAVVAGVGFAAHGAATPAEHMRDLLRQGARDFIAPELWRGAMPEAVADIYSLGAVLYLCLTGRPPYDTTLPGGPRAALQGMTPTAPSILNRESSAELDDVILRALARSPNARFANGMAGFERALRALQTAQ
jgi:serine/threonine-protein kinase